MKTWLIIIGLIIAVIIFILIVSLISSKIIYKSASEHMKYLENKYISKIKKYMPNKKCENCSYENCDEYAYDLLYKKTTFICPLCSENDLDKIEVIINDYENQFLEMK